MITHFPQKSKDKTDYYYYNITQVISVIATQEFPKLSGSQWTSTKVLTDQATLNFCAAGWGAVHFLTQSLLSIDKSYRRKL